MEARSAPRTQRLVDATLQIASGIDLEGALRCFLDTTRRMVGARYGAIGLVSRDHLVRFVPAGTNADVAASLGQRPDGTGGPMRSFLGVPITVGGEAFGTVYLAEKRDGTEFSAQDRALVRALASAAGVAIEHAELLDEARRRQDWLRAGTTITTLLLSGEDPQAVRSVVTGQAMQLDGAVAAAIIAPTEDPDLLRVAAGSGGLDPQVVGKFLPAGDALSRLAHTRGGAIVVEGLQADPRTPGSVSRTLGAGGLGPTVAAPLSAATGDDLLLVARDPQQRPFRPPDVEMIASFAAHVGLALDLAESRRRRDVERLVEDRERIAAHLSERAMRALLEISTTVHGLTARMRSPDDAQRLAEQVNRLDRVLREMQRAIFGLSAQPGEWQGSAAR